MTNKELFNQLNKEQQMEIIKTLMAFDEVHVEYYNGKYHITTNYVLLAKYPSDYKMLNEFTKKEFYEKINFNYFDKWYDFVEAKKRNGEKNSSYRDEKGEVHGKWQDEFEKSCEPIYQQALNNYLEVRA